MRTSLAVIVFMVVVSFILVPETALAQYDYDGIDQQTLTDACEGTMDPDTCMGSGTMTIQTCTDSFGCLNCALNATLTDSVCYRLYQASGHCTCKPNGTTIDQYGIRRPRCTMEGTCMYR